MKTFKQFLKEDGDLAVYAEDTVTTALADDMGWVFDENDGRDHPFHFEFYDRSDSKSRSVNFDISWKKTKGLAKLYDGDDETLKVKIEDRAKANEAKIKKFGDDSILCFFNALRDKRKILKIKAVATNDALIALNKPIELADLPRSGSHVCTLIPGKA